MAPEIEWQANYSRQGILVEKGDVPDSPYHAFRGTAMVEASLGRVISVLYDYTRANEWVHQLRDSVALRVDDPNLVVWQRYDNPWPVKDRDFIYYAEPRADLQRGTFEAEFIDIARSGITLTNEELSLIPDRACCIRGTIIHAAWIFQSAAPGRTCVRVEIVMDPQGKVPISLVNRTQRDWPFATIDGLRRQVAKQDIAIHETFGDWEYGDASNPLPSTLCEDIGD